MALNLIKQYCMVRTLMSSASAAEEMRTSSSAIEAPRETATDPHTRQLLILKIENRVMEREGGCVCVCVERCESRKTVHSCLL